MCSRGTAVGSTRVAQRRFADQHVIGRAVAVAAVDAEPGRGVALRIEIDDQHALADGGQRGAEIDRGRGLADAALLVGERQDARMGRLGLANYPLDKPDQLRVMPGSPYAVADGLRRSIRSSSTIQPCRPVRLEWSCGLNIPIFSGFGQFSLYILSLEE